MSISEAEAIRIGTEGERLFRAYADGNGIPYLWIDQQTCLQSLQERVCIFLTLLRRCRPDSDRHPRLRRMPIIRRAPEMPMRAICCSRRVALNGA
jgi:hypothetical protein